MMLLEPGPMRLFTDDEIPRDLAPPDFAGLAAREAGELEAGARVLEIAGGALTPGVGAPEDLAVASDLVAAAAEHESQSKVSDSAIGDVAAGAGVLEGDLSGLTSELAGELAGASMPDTPPEPDDADNEDWKDPEYGAIINEWFVKYLDREAPADYLEDLRNAHARLVDVLAGILNSPEYLEKIAPPGATPPPGTEPPPEGEPPPEPPPNVEYINGYVAGTPALIEAYVSVYTSWRDNFERFLADNPGDEGRAPSALEADNWNAFALEYYGY
jgi:hypothetical protein